MCGVEIRQGAALEEQRGGRRGKEGWPAPLYRASWSTVCFWYSLEVPYRGISKESP